MVLLVNDFESRQKHCVDTGEALYQPVLTYEIELKSCPEEFIWPDLALTYHVM